MADAPRAHHEVVETDVVVVGFGPVGVTAANLLGTYGIRTEVVEREQSVFPRARAVTVNDWTLRIFQSFGMAERAMADMEENSVLRWKTYQGREVFRLGARDSGLGYPGSMMIYQPAMETVLREGVARFEGTVNVRFGDEVTDIHQDTDCVEVTVRSQHGSERRIRARYALACDGGSSTVRSRMGVAMLGETHETEWIIIDAEMLRWWPGCKDLVFWSDPDRPVVDIPLSLGHHRWEFPLQPGERKEDFDSDEAIWRLLRSMGRTPEEVRIERHAFYVHHVRHAERWRVGRVLLLGDAAHLMPPWAGQGMQSGIRDAANAVWKVREVLEGRIGDSLLDSYEAERAPQVAQVTQLSQKLGMLIASGDPRFVTARNTLGPVLKHVTPLTRVIMSGSAPALSAGWFSATPSKSGSVGQMVPQPPISTSRGRRAVFDEALGTGFSLVGYDKDPRVAIPAIHLAAWERLGARAVTVRNRDGQATSPNDFIDHTGLLGDWMRDHHSSVVVVRPDHFVAASDADGLHVPGGVREGATTSAAAH